MKHSFNLLKILALPIASIMIFFSLGAPRVNALIFVPTNDTLLNVTTASHASAQDVAFPALDTIMYSIGQQLLTSLTDSTVNWIKGGFSGSPAFAVDAEKLFLDTANMVTGGLANQIRGIATCDFDFNFNNDLANRVTMSTRSGATAKFSDQIKCPFPSTINASDFYKDFNKGGWGAYETALADNGNPFGVMLLTSQELTARQTGIQHIKEQQLSWGSGFLPLEVCEEVSTSVDADGAFSDDVFGDGSGKTTICKTTTPGKVISDTLSKSIGTDMDRIGFADNMNKIISAFVASLTSSVTSGIF